MKAPQRLGALFVSAVAVRLAGSMSTSGSTSFGDAGGPSGDAALASHWRTIASRARQWRGAFSKEPSSALPSSWRRRSTMGTIFASFQL